MSFDDFAIPAVLTSWVVCWTVVFLYRFDQYTRNRKHFRFINQFEHIGQERAELALAERIKEEAREFSQRFSIPEDTQ